MNSRKRRGNRPQNWADADESRQEMPTPASASSFRKIIAQAAHKAASSRVRPGRGCVAEPPRGRARRHARQSHRGVNRKRNNHRRFCRRPPRADGIGGRCLTGQPSRDDVPGAMREELGRLGPASIARSRKRMRSAKRLAAFRRWISPDRSIPRRARLRCNTSPP